MKKTKKQVIEERYKIKEKEMECLRQRIRFLEKQIKMYKNFYNQAMYSWRRDIRVWFVYCLLLIIGFNILLILK